MTLQNVENRFSKQSALYAKSRPSYPAELLEFITSQCENKGQVWDCATGSGQAAIGLAQYFGAIHASDQSPEQLEHATKHPKVEYHVENAEHTSQDDNSVDLVTVAQAVHWFNLDRFYTEAKRVMKQSAVIALWGYGMTNCSDKKIDDLFQSIGRDILKDYWDDHVKLIWAGYDKLPFPFEEIDTPHFEISTFWTRDNFEDYVHSWSAAQKFINKNGYSPLDQLQSDLDRIWKDRNQAHIFKTALTTRIGRKT